MYSVGPYRPTVWAIPHGFCGKTLAQLLDYLLVIWSKISLTFAFSRLFNSVGFGYLSDSWFNSVFSSLCSRESRLFR